MLKATAVIVINNGLIYAVLKTKNIDYIYIAICICMFVMYELGRYIESDPE